jgi:aryl-alcohol dehydrogenase-like predicted oxidoreductase
VVERLEAFAAVRGIALVDVVIAGLAAQAAVASVIAGATRPEQVRANVAALAWEPSAADLAELDRIAPTPRS